jgi:hypothetical protein
MHVCLFLLLAHSVDLVTMSRPSVDLVTISRPRLTQEQSRHSPPLPSRHLQRRGRVELHGLPTGCAQAFCSEAEATVFENLTAHAYLMMSVLPRSFKIFPGLTLSGRLCVPKRFQLIPDRTVRTGRLQVSLTCTAAYVVASRSDRLRTLLFL